MALKAQYSIVLQSTRRPNDISECSVLKCDGTSTFLFSYVFVSFSIHSCFFSFQFSFIFHFSLPVSFVPFVFFSLFLNLFLCFIRPVLFCFPSLILYLFPSFIPLSFHSLLCLCQIPSWIYKTDAQSAAHVQLRFNLKTKAKIFAECSAPARLNDGVARCYVSLCVHKTNV